MPDTALRPKDFVLLDDGSWYAVVTDPLADGRQVVMRRYGPAPEGWRKVAARGAWVGPVDPARVREVRRPRERLRALIQGAASDPLEERAARAALYLLGAGVPRDRLGVTGSLLLGLSQHDSDIDLAVYGRAAFHAARIALAQGVAEGRFAALTLTEWDLVWQRRRPAIDLEAYVAHEVRKHTRAMLDGIRLDLGAVPDLEELVRDEPVAVREGRRTIAATVLDATRAFDLPARWRVAHDEVGEVVCWTQTYVGQAREGETIEAAGVLERDVLGRRRLVVGTNREAPGEYVVVPAITSPVRGTPRSAGRP